jgi:hypothetical protein
MKGQKSGQVVAQQGARSTEARAPSDGVDSGQARENGRGVWRKFAEPRGWALKWDGTALFMVRRR